MVQDFCKFFCDKFANIVKIMVFTSLNHDKILYKQMKIIHKFPTRYSTDRLRLSILRYIVFERYYVYN